MEHTDRRSLISSCSQSFTHWKRGWAQTISRRCTPKSGNQKLDVHLIWYGSLPNPNVPSALTGSGSAPRFICSGLCSAASSNPPSAAAHTLKITLAAPLLLPGINHHLLIAPHATLATTTASLRRRQEPPFPNTTHMAPTSHAQPANSTLRPRHRDI
jgi:hypothetical protein